VHRYIEPGKNTIETLPELIKQALAKLNLPKSMRWGNGEYTFIRPVQWLVLLFGKDIVDAEIFGVKTGNKTVGHRFHHPEAITINDPNNYETILEKEGKVIADFAKRKKIISDQVSKIEQNKNYKAVIDADLLEEVTGIVEWPVTLLGTFDQRFINLPKEVLITSMQHHQKCFPVIGVDDVIKPYFITVSNIESKDVAQVIAGNKRVIEARLSDAEFFYDTDHKRHLSDYVEDLKHVIFQHKLGSSYEKSLRIKRLAKLIAGSLQIETELAEKAGFLCKADLMTSMVGEFPDLQGIMGYYYAQRENKEAAKNQAENEKNNSIAVAIRDHYLPRFAGDKLPESKIACAVALADRFDTIVGLFGINQPPTGEKDPFGLRRAAISILRIIIENKLDINLCEIIEWAVPGYTNLPNENVKDQVHDFIKERLRAYYAEQGILADTLAAVVAVQDLFPLDIDHRLHAVQAFRQLPEAEVLSLANKRAMNILEKSEVDKTIIADNAIKKIKPELFEKPEEQAIYDMILQKNNFHIDSNPAKDLKLSAQEYTKHLHSLAELHKPVNDFFDAVMVNVEDQKIRTNRLLLVTAMRQLFLQVADISLLQI
jgi:glycyl-tRNA synthetase beta chain